MRHASELWDKHFRLDGGGCAEEGAVSEEPAQGTCRVTPQNTAFLLLVPFSSAAMIVNAHPAEPTETAWYKTTRTTPHRPQVAVVFDHVARRIVCVELLLAWPHIRLFAVA